MILPSPSRDTEAYWAAAREGRFVLRRCPTCAKWRHPRERSCCPGAAPEWREASGGGTLLGYTVVRLALNPALAGQVPYTITLTRTAEGPNVLSSLPGDGHALRCGMPMRVVFDRVTESVTLPRFAPEGESPHG